MSATAYLQTIARQRGEWAALEVAADDINKLRAAADALTAERDAAQAKLSGLERDAEQDHAEILAWIARSDRMRQERDVARARVKELEAAALAALDAVRLADIYHCVELTALAKMVVSPRLRLLGMEAHPDA